MVGCASPSPAVQSAPTTAPTPAATATLPPTPSPSPTPDAALAPVTYAWISDTQGYASTYPETFLAMTKWIVSEKDALNIQYVIHTGDIVNDMTRQREWERATQAMDEFIGKIPVFAIAGNHDIKGMMHFYQDFSTLMDRQGYQDYPTFGAEEADGRRRYDLVTIGHDPFLLIGVGYSLAPSDVDWLNATLRQYSDRTAILIAHSYLTMPGKTPELDAQMLHGVVAANPNILYVFCGHAHGLLREQQSFDDNGDGVPDRTVQAIMADYQGFDQGGMGYVVLLTFDPGRREIRATSYSPTLDDYNYYDDPSRETYTIPLSVVPPVSY